MLKNGFRLTFGQIGLLSPDLPGRQRPSSSQLSATTPTADPDGISLSLSMGSTLLGIVTLAFAPATPCCSPAGRC